MARPLRSTPRLHLGAALLAALLAFEVQPAGAADPPLAGMQLEDRMLAVVDDDPVLASDVERLIRLGLVERRREAGAVEDEESFRARVLEALIEQRLRFHEVERFGFEEVPVAALDGEVARLRARFTDPTELDRRLREAGLDEAGLRQLLLRQLMVLTYVEERLGPRVFIRQEEIVAYYQEKLVPELQAARSAVPPLDEVREEIRRVLREERLNAEIADWTAKLRERAEVEVYREPRTGGLPPLAGRKP